MTLQEEFHEQHRRFHANIARRAALVPKPINRTYTIPNTPFGIPKIPPKPRKPVWTGPNLEPLWWHCMWFADLIAMRAPKGPATASVERIQRVVCRRFNISLIDMKSDRRTANVVNPRQVAMYLCKELTLRSLPELGRRFGNRDHTTVLHGIRKIAARCVSSPEYAGMIAELKAELR